MPSILAPPSTKRLVVMRLEELQNRLQLNDEAFASFVTEQVTEALQAKYGANAAVFGFGFGRSMWSRLRGGNRNVTNELARALAAKWPEFWSLHVADETNG